MVANMSIKLIDNIFQWVCHDQKMKERNAMNLMCFLPSIDNKMKQLWSKQHCVHGCCQSFIARQW